LIQGEGFKQLLGHELTDEEKEKLRKWFNELSPKELEEALKWKPPYGNN